MSGRRLLTTRQAAELLGVVPETVLRWIGSRGLPAVRLTSRAIRIPEDALDVWVAEHVTAGAAERSVSPVRPEPRPPSADPSRTPQVATLRTVTSPVGLADDNRKERS